MNISGTRVLAGEFKGRKIHAVPRNLPVRPILARMKKSLFDILKNRIAGAVFLDLFAGSGSVGLEALSRGARKVVFVDSNPGCIRWIQKNTNMLSVNKSFALKSSAGQQALCYCKNILSGLDWLDEQFDLIFSGAPYVDRQKQPLFFVQKLFTIISQRKILEKNGWLMAQHHKKETFEIPNDWLLFRQERYGDSLISFCRMRLLEGKQC